MTPCEVNPQAENRASIVVALFVPFSDQAGQPIRQSVWVTAGRTLFNDVFANAQASDVSVNSRTRVVASHLGPDGLTDDNLKRVGDFARQFGRSTNQREVGLVVNDLYHPITTFDDPAVPEAAVTHED